MARENHFKRLPDELIVHQILDKILEPKWLFNCSLVSKYFSTLVFQTHKISCTLPLTYFDRKKYPENTTDSPENASQCYRLFLRLLHTEMMSSPFSKETIFSAQLTANFLTKFTSLKSLHLELDYCARNLWLEPIGKWRFDPKSETFVLLLVESDDDSSQVTNQMTGAEAADGITGSYLSEVYLTYFRTDARCRYSLIEKLVPYLSKELESIVISDSLKQGVLVLDKKDLAPMRDSRHSRDSTKTEAFGRYRNIEEYFQTRNSGKLKTGHASVSVLPLPLSNCVMRNVTLFVSKCSDEIDENMIVRKAFKGEEQRYAEAATKMIQMIS